MHIIFLVGLVWWFGFVMVGCLVGWSVGRSVGWMTVWHITCTCIFTCMYSLSGLVGRLFGSFLIFLLCLFLEFKLLYDSYFGHGSLPTIVTGLECVGNEGSLLDCRHNKADALSSCSSSSIVGIVCKGERMLTS